jgi:hypothetical protein
VDLGNLLEKKPHDNKRQGQGHLEHKPKAWDIKVVNLELVSVLLLQLLGVFYEQQERLQN